MPEPVFKLESANLYPRHLEISPDGKQSLTTIRPNAVGVGHRASGGEAAVGRNPLKALDEYNYCRF